MRKLSLILSAGLVGAAATLAAPALAETMEYTITLTDGVVEPQMLDITAGEAFSLLLVNAGATPAEFESKSLHLEQVIAPGASFTFDLSGLAAGDYKFVEEFHEDQPTGRGVISVK